MVYFVPSYRLLYGTKVNGKFEIDIMLAAVGSLRNPAFGNILRRAPVEDVLSALVPSTSSVLRRVITKSLSYPSPAVVQSASCICDNAMDKRTSCGREF